MFKSKRSIKRSIIRLTTKMMQLRLKEQDKLLFLLKLRPKDLRNRPNKLKSRLRKLLRALKVRDNRLNNNTNRRDLKKNKRSNLKFKLELSMIILITKVKKQELRKKREKGMLIRLKEKRKKLQESSLFSMIMRDRLVN